MITTMIVAALLQASPLPVQAVVKGGARPKPATAAVTRNPRRSRVVVDAGHGGRDPGAPIQGTHVREKDIALQVALRLGDALRDRGVEVVYTRTRDTLIARKDRGLMANAAKADLFISIHVNAANPRWKDPGAARGFETFFQGIATTDDAREVEARERESERFEDGGGQGDALDFIVADMMRNEYLRESSDLATIIQRHLGGVHPGPNRGVKQANFTVLLTAFMPAVLVEVGFGTNRQEAAYLLSATRQARLAEAIAHATMEYLQRHEARVSGGTASSAR